jgi:hypothetical protein
MSFYELKILWGEKARVISKNEGTTYQILTQIQVTPVSSSNKTDHHDITEILLKVALNIIDLNPTYFLKLVSI